MIRLFVAWTACLLTLISITSASASNYPTDYNYQRVRLVHKTPALLAFVGSGITSKLIIAYDKKGLLNQFNPQSIDAIVTIVCHGQDGKFHNKTTTVSLGHEWHGKGYISYDLDPSKHLPLECLSSDFWRMGLAFSDTKGHWDSLYEQNYQFNTTEFWGKSAKPLFFKNEQSSGLEVSEAIWNFILTKM